MPLLLDESDGYLEIVIPAPATETEPARDVAYNLDLYEANNKYAQLCDVHDPNEKPVELQQAWADWLTQEKGLPPLSLGNGMRILAEVVREVAVFKKKHGPASATADSADSSASPDSAAPGAI